MSSSLEPQWLQWAKKLHEIAQNGLHYANDEFDVERYQAIREIASEIMAEHSDVDAAYVRTLFAGEVGHATPKIDTRAVVFRDDEILLV